MSIVRSFLERAALDTRERQSWVLFDLGDQGFSTVILGVILPIYYVDAAGGTSIGWSYTLAISFAIIAVLSPVLGTLADYLENSRGFLAIFTAVGVISTAAMFLTRQGDFILLSVLVIVANIGFRGARLFYNSLLPGIASEDTIDRVSAAGFAAGYLGGTLILIIAFVLILSPSTFGLPDTAAASRLALFAAACWWGVFAIPVFIYVPEPERAEEEQPSGNPVRSAFSRLHGSFREIQRFEMAFLFLVAFWFYINGVNAIIYLSAAYATEIGIGQNSVMASFLLVQFIGIPCALLFGQLADYLTTKKAIYIGLAVYICIALAAVGISTAAHFFALAFFVGLVQGGTQSISRSLFGSLIPDHKSGEFFSFYTIVAGSASIASPLLFGFVGQITGSNRLAIASVSLFFIVGTLLLTRVDVEQGRTVARETTPAGASDSSEHPHSPV